MYLFIDLFHGQSKVKGKTKDLLSKYKNLSLYLRLQIKTN